MPLSLRFAPLALLLALVGCGASKEPIELSAEMEPRDEKYFPMTAPNKNWNGVVSAKTDGAAVDIYLVKAGTEEEAIRIVRKSDAKQILASKIEKVNPTFDAEIPADTVYGVFVVNTDRNRRARVTIKLTEK